MAGKKWRIKTNDGRYFFIERETLLNGTDVYVVRTEERVYDLAPRSVVFEIVGGARIVDPEHAEPAQGRPDRVVRALRRLPDRAEPAAVRAVHHGRRLGQGARQPQRPR